MIKFNRTGFVFISTVMIFGLTSCGLKSYFPDKEKDYQFSQEISPLTLPSDLRNTTFKRQRVKPKVDETEAVKVIAEMTAENTVKETSDKSKPIEYVEVDKAALNVNAREDIVRPADEETQVNLVMFDGGATRLRINENFSPIWRLVGKALSRNRIEITSRNKAAGQFIVQYDPNKTDFVDDSVKDEFLFIFADNHSQEKELKIRLVTHNNHIEVIILDDDNQPLSDGAGLKLLKLLFSTLHTELAAQK
ncbi:MAG: outer membrane protein assembly factor BamC [Methylococcales bacterium]|nr:outer membrane protein assembly factor BamC [Methylococcales bacterium]